MILGVLLIGEMLVSPVSAQSDLEKIFTLSKGNIVEERLSTFKNGAKFDYHYVRLEMITHSQEH